MEAVKLVLIYALYLLALLNPVSKVPVLAAMASSEEPSALRGVVVKSTLVAGAILLAVMLFGNFVLQGIFHVQIYPHYGTDRYVDRGSDGF